MRIFTKKWFEKKIGIALNQAGPRYSPKVNVSLPINRLFYGLGRTDEFYEEFHNLRQEFTKVWDESSLKRNFNQINLPKKDFNNLSKEIGKIISFLDGMKEVEFDDIVFKDGAMPKEKIARFIILKRARFTRMMTILVILLKDLPYPGCLRTQGIKDLM